MVFDLEKFSSIELTSIENAALSRLSVNNDFDILCDILLRTIVVEGQNLVRTPREGQEGDLFHQQGGFMLFRQMLKYVRTAEPPPHPKAKKDE